MTLSANLYEAAAELRRPFTAEAIEWKLAELTRDAERRPRGCIAVPYIDRGLVIDRLNRVVPHLWSDRLERDGDEVRCWLTIDGVTREDIGEAKSIKARYTDALKRAAVKFGVGAYLTRVPVMHLMVADGDVEIWQRGAVTGLDLTDRGRAKLLTGLQEWLKLPAVIEQFGGPLDVGDLGESVGDADEHEPSPENAADAEVTEALADELASNRFTIREIEGILKATGATVPLTIRRGDVHELVDAMTVDQRETLTDLLQRTPVAA